MLLEFTLKVRQGTITLIAPFHRLRTKEKQSSKGFFAASTGFENESLQNLGNMIEQILIQCKMKVFN